MAATGDHRGRHEHDDRRDRDHSRDKHDMRRDERRDRDYSRNRYDERRDNRRNRSTSRDRNRGYERERHEDRRDRSTSRDRNRGYERERRENRRDDGRDKESLRGPYVSQRDDGRNQSETRRENNRGRVHEDTTGRKLFVASMSFDTTEESLKALFGTVGKVVACHIALSKETGQSRGFGFVTYDSIRSASEALTELDETELDGRTIKVKLATEDGGGKQGNTNKRSAPDYSQDVDVSAYKPEKIAPEQERVILKQSKLPSEMMKNGGTGSALDFVYSDDDEGDDPELAFVNSLSAKEKRKLLKKMAADDDISSPSRKKSKKEKKEKKHRKHKKDRKERKTNGSSSDESH